MTTDTSLHTLENILHISTLRLKSDDAFTLCDLSAELHLTTRKLPATFLHHAIPDIMHIHHSKCSTH